MIIDQLPLIVKEAANGLRGANINVLNGADGLSEIAAGLVGQGLAILDSVKKGLAEDGSASGGKVVQGESSSSRKSEAIEIESGN
jgi:hypothetical protein